MKEIKAIIQPFMLPHVLDALHAIDGFPGATTSVVQGIGARESGSFEQHLRTKLEIIATDRLVDPVVEAIQRFAHTGKAGDGYVFVIPLERVVKIRTGDEGRDA